jgi:hypothetical protein
MWFFDLYHTYLNWVYFGMGAACILFVWWIISFVARNWKLALALSGIVAAIALVMMAA